MAHLLCTADQAPPKGRRYTNEIKRQALLLHYSGPKAYNHLSQMFNLPCKTSLNKWLSTMKCLPGFHDECFDTIMLGLKHMNHRDNACYLLIDEISLKKLLTV